VRQVLGCVLVLTVCFQLGLSQVRVYRRRLRLSRETAVCLRRMEAELTERLTPLPELLSALGEEAPPLAGALFGALARGTAELERAPFGALWQETLDAYRDPGLTPELRRSLEELGWQLGRYSAQVQGQAVRACRERTEALAREQSRELETRTRLSLGLSLCAGAGAVILLL
jgi:stage III sporulation protein AB